MIHRSLQNVGCVASTYNIATQTWEAVDKEEESKQTDSTAPPSSGGVRQIPPVECQCEGKREEG